VYSAGTDSSVLNVTVEISISLISKLMVVKLSINDLSVNLYFPLNCWRVKSKSVTTRSQVVVVTSLKLAPLFGSKY